ncbi:MAG: DUF3616 domain-containing protein [Pleurocapsa sp.]
MLIIVLFPNQSNVFSKANLPSTDKIKFQGKIIADKALSAIGFVGKYILLGADEGNQIQVLEPNKRRSKYRVAKNKNIKLLVDKSKSEIDIEGIAVSNNIVYVVGSHSLQKETTPDENARKNIFRFEIDPDTCKLKSPIVKASLQAILSQDKILNQFFNLPHSKNGVDIEGIAVKNEYLYFGFRTPILYNKYTPVVVVKFEDINRTDSYKLHCINLDGNGIRDIVAVDRVFLVLTDETGNNGNNYQVYFWDGSYGLSKSINIEKAKLLSEIPAKKNTRAEGLTILQETNESYRILVVYDGIAEGNPTIFEIYK